ncbi:FkbM family methyltransferase [Candidatus Margulisiibacteriota bacterium]
MNIKKSYNYLFRWFKRKHFIDCGAHIGESILYAQHVFGKNIRSYSFEAIPKLADNLKTAYSNNTDIKVFNNIVWIKNEVKKIYCSKEFTDGSSVYHEKKTGGLDKNVSIEVTAINLSEWIRSNFKKTDFIILKLDIEGAEYEVLNKLITDGTIEYINILCGEFHCDKIDTKRMRFLKNKIDIYFNKNKINFYTWECINTKSLTGTLACRPKTLA